MTCSSFLHLPSTGVSGIIHQTQFYENQLSNIPDHKDLVILWFWLCRLQVKGSREGGAAHPGAGVPGFSSSGAVILQAPCHVELAPAIFTFMRLPTACLSGSLHIYFLRHKPYWVGSAPKYVAPDCCHVSYDKKKSGFLSPTRLVFKK